MSKEKEKGAKGKVTAPEEQGFKGYDLEELRYQRAVLALKKEFAKEKVMADIADIRKRLPFSKDNTSRLSLPGAKGILGKVLGGLGYVDYFLLGFSVINTGRKVFSFFRKGKK